MVDFLKSGQVGTIELNETRKMRNEIANRWSSLGSKTVNEGKTNYQYQKNERTYQYQKNEKRNR